MQHNWSNKFPSQTDIISLSPPDSIYTSIPWEQLPQQSFWPMDSRLPLDSQGDNRATSIEEMFGYDRCSTTKEKSWSQLPFLLLWMIKDRLDFIDNVQLASVCRNWYSASASYTKKSIQSASSPRLPWIMQELEVNSSSRDFICMSRRKTFTIDLPEFHGATTLFSKQGWLLLWRKNFSYSATAGSRTNSTDGSSNNGLPCSVFLMNPFTRATVKLPDVEKDVIPSVAGSFSTTVEGYPHCVVLRGSHSRQGLGLILRIAYVGDDQTGWWSEISFAGDNTAT